jgi:hypothetical protein
MNDFYKAYFNLRDSISTAQWEIENGHRLLENTESPAQAPSKLLVHSPRQNRQSTPCGKPLVITAL